MTTHNLTFLWRWLRNTQFAQRSGTEVESMRPRIIPYLIVLAFLAVASRAQDGKTPAAPSPTTSPAPSSQASSGSDRVILKVGNLQVTEEEFESRISDIEGQSGDPDKAGTNEKDRRKLGDDYGSVLMLSQQAIANHLDSSPEVRRQLATARMQVLSDAEFASLMRQAEPTTEEISRYYAAHLSDYDQVQIRRLFIWRRRDNSKDGQVLSSEAARAHADEIRQAYATGTDAKKLSADLRKSGDGMLDPEPLTFPRGELSAHMEKIAFALKPGEWAEVEDTPARLLVVQLVKHDRQQLGEVSGSIEKELQAQKMQSILDDLKKKTGIWMDEQYFGTAASSAPGVQRHDSDPPSELEKSATKGESGNDEQSK
jgi:hypothetical protein